jgi:Predicted sugar nucleotidyltransferases
MKAVILAAGLGSRLSSVTSGKPKCLVELHGKSILRHQLDLLAACDITQVTIVTGFGAKLIRSHVKERASLVYYPNFASTNNLLTLHYCRRLLTDEVLLLFADVLLTRKALQDCASCPSDFALLVDSSQCREGTMRVRLSESSVLDIGSHIKTSEGHGNFVGVARFSAHGSELLAAELDEIVATRECSAAYYTDALASLAAKGHRLEPVSIDGSSWLEVDTEEDYLTASSQAFYL